jgi:hypothetical protein
MYLDLVQANFEQLTKAANVVMETFPTAYL